MASPNVNLDPEQLLQQHSNPDLAVSGQEIEIEIGGVKHKIPHNEVNGFVHSLAAQAADELKKRDEALARMQAAAQTPQVPRNPAEPEQFSEEKLAKLLNEDPKKAWSYAFKYTDEYNNLKQEATYGKQALMQLQEMTFLAQNPDFPRGNPQVNQVMQATMQALNLPPNANGFDVAWTYVKAKAGLNAPPPQPEAQNQPQYNAQPQASPQTNPGYFPPGWGGQNPAPPPSTSRSGAGAGQDPISDNIVASASKLKTSDLKAYIEKLTESGIRMPENW